VSPVPGASDSTRRVKVLNANWTTAASPAAMSAIVALSQANTVLAWDPTNQTLIAANIVGTMPWTVDH